MDLPRLVVTGASGFLGRHVLEAFKGTHRIYALGRRSQSECGAPEHENILWYQVDIGEPKPLAQVFDAILADGGAEIVIHLAAHYDFTGEDHPEYWRTNVAGLRNVLEICRHMHLRRFFFASSVAASQFPPPGQALNEDSRPDGDHIYAITKRIGEEMIEEYRDSVPACIIRFGAMFSDWCEYPPLYIFLDTWLSHAWRKETALNKVQILKPSEVLVASTSGATNHLELFRAATLAYHGRASRYILMPRILCGPGMWGRDLVGRLLGARPFERPWMAKYIDLVMNVDASRTYDRLGWAPKTRLDVVRRMPFLVENFKSNPGEWHRLNRAAMKEVRVRSNLKVHRLLEQHEGAIVRAMMEELQGPQAKWSLRYRRIKAEDLQWNVRQLVRHLMNAVRTREKAIFKHYCRDLAQLRYQQGFSVHEVVKALETTRDVCLRELESDPARKGLEQAVHDCVDMTFSLGIDEAQDVFEELAGICYLPPPPG